MSITELLQAADQAMSTPLELKEEPRSSVVYRVENIFFVDDKKEKCTYLVVETFTSDVAVSVKISDRTVGHQALTMFSGGVPIAMVVRHFGLRKVLPAGVSMYVKRKRKIVENTKPKPSPTPLFS